MNPKLFAAGAALVMAGSAGAARAECGEVSITQMDWASASIVTAVSKFLMEQGYGCEVTAMPSSTPTALTSVAETGEPDILTELWVNTAPAYERMRDAGEIVELGPVLSDGGVEGWWVPDYLVEAHPELATLDGVLANPELVGGRFHGCPDGWACRTIDDNMDEVIGFEDQGIEVFDHGSGETLATSIAAAYADEAPWFGFYWAPTAVLGKYPMTMVEIAPHDAETHACNSDPECPDPGLSNYPAADVMTAVTADFQEREPEIAELMSKVAFTNEQMGEILAWQEDQSASPDEAAVYFLSNNPDVWSEWLSEEARGRLSALIE